MKIIYLALFLGFLALSSAAQSPAATLKKGEKALGGAKRIAAARGWVRTGTVIDPETGASGNFRSTSWAPNLYHVVYDLNGIEFERGFNGKSGWERDSRNGLRTLTGDESLVSQSEAAFRSSYWLNYKKEKSRAVSGGTITIEGRPASMVRITSPKGVETILSFDTASGQLITEEIRSGESVSTINFADFRDAGGVKLPFRANIHDGTQRLEVVFAEILPVSGIASSIFDFPKVSGEPLPDIPRLLTELQANEDAVEELLDQYSYSQRSTRREIGKDGRLRETGSETYQLSFYKGRRIRRLIEKDGKPLSTKDQAEADRDAEKQVEEIEKEAARNEKRGGSGPPDENSRRISIAEVLRASRLLNPRRERLRGRDVIVFDFEPNPNFDYKNAKSMLKFFGKTAGVMWIDEKDKQVARLEAYLADSYKIGGGVLAKLRKGASFTLEQERLNNEIWLPSYANIDLSVRVLLVKGISVNQEVRSFDYRKFATEVKDAKVGDPEDK